MPSHPFSARPLSRRQFGKTLGAVSAATMLPKPWAWAEAGRPVPKAVGKRVLLKAKGPQESAWYYSYYTRPEGLELASIASVMTRSDTSDLKRRRFSPDNGQSWSEWEAIDFITKRPEGTYRELWSPGWVDPETGFLLNIGTAGLLPKDNPMEGMTQWSLRYRVTNDGGRSHVTDEQIIQEGDFDAAHPMEGVWVGKNSAMIGASSCRPIRTRQGEILVPCQITPIGPDGKYFNPGGGYSYHEAVVLIGTWDKKAPKDQPKLRWQCSQFVANDPKRSTRGCVEPTILEMPDGRILMVIRGSNDVKPALPGHKWYTVSDDGGHTWSPVRPWSYTDGQAFFSPSSCSQLIRHSSGRIYWIGNIAPKNPRGNAPRYPLVIGEVDPKSLLLIRDTVTTIDTIGPNDYPSLQLSNFLAREDRQSKEIVIEVCRLFYEKGQLFGDAYEMRVEV